MSSRSTARQRDVDAPTTSLKPLPVKLSTHTERLASANDEHASPKRERAVDPLWMIAVAMAFAFALLGMLATFS